MSAMALPWSYVMAIGGFGGGGGAVARAAAVGGGRRRGWRRHARSRIKTPRRASPRWCPLERPWLHRRDRRSARAGTTLRRVEAALDVLVVGEGFLDQVGAARRVERELARAVGVDEVHALAVDDRGDVRGLELLGSGRPAPPPRARGPSSDRSRPGRRRLGGLDHGVEVVDAVGRDEQLAAAGFLSGGDQTGARRSPLRPSSWPASLNRSLVRDELLRNQRGELKVLTTCAVDLRLARLALVALHAPTVKALR